MKGPQEHEVVQHTSFVWLAADYYFPSTYSCRIPMSSMNSARIMPAPGPATVRLALIRTGIACYGLDMVRETLFPILRSVIVRVRPPERVAIAQHVLRAYKWSHDKARRERAQESIIVREMAHASGPLTVFLQIPAHVEQRLRVVLQAIGYWGQSSSLSSCLAVTRTSPELSECATPLSQFDGTFPRQPYFSCLATEFRSNRISWDEIVADDDTQKTEALRLDVYLWPLITEYRDATQHLLVRTPLAWREGKGP